MDEMNKIGELLAQLRDIHLPTSPGWWPPAPGWWILLLLIGAGIAAAIYFYRAHQAHLRSPIYLALQELDGLDTASHEDKQLLCTLSALLRRMAISLYPRSEIAALNGTSWIEWLKQHSDATPLDQQLLLTITEAPYRPSHEAYDRQRALDTCRALIIGLDAYRKNPEGVEHV